MDCLFNNETNIGLVHIGTEAARIENLIFYVWETGILELSLKALAVSIDAC